MNFHDTLMVVAFVFISWSMITLIRPIKRTPIKKRWHAVFPLLMGISLTYAAENFLDKDLALSQGLAEADEAKMVKHPQSNSGDAPEPLQSGQTQQHALEEVVDVTAVILDQDYDSNTVMADMKYKDKLLQVSGVVANIGKIALFDTPYVALRGKNIFSTVTCSFSVDDEPQLAMLSKGQTVVLRARLSGSAFGVKMRDCQLVQK